MSSKFIEHSPEAEADKSLILIMDEDGNVTTDPTHFEKLISTKQLPEVGIKIVRLNSSQGESDNGVGNDEKPELKLTVEEIYPDSLSLGSSDTSSNVLNSTLELLPGTSNEHINHDIVDPFSQMDPEQLQRLEHALASEQAKQILGENVAAMLDMLSVEETPASFLQNSIKNDHCYTNLLPSSDPNGPSFFVGDVRSISSDVSKGKGKTKVASPVKARKVVHPAGSPAKRQIIKDTLQHPKPQQQQREHGIVFGTPRIKPLPENDDPNYDEDVDIEDMDSEASGGEEEDNLSDEDYNDRTGKRGGKRKPRRGKKILMKKQAPGRPPGRPAGKPGRMSKRSRALQEIRARNEKLNDEMAKVVQSMDYASKSDEDKSDSSKGFRKVFKKKRSSKEEVPVGEEPRVVVESQLPEAGSGTKSQQAKYPKRENRKPPAHLAEAFGPALFSTPDIIRRISTGDEVQTPSSDKKNFTVGVQKTPTPADGKAASKTLDGKMNKIKTEGVFREGLNHVKPASNALSGGEGFKTGSSLLKPLKVTSPQKVKVTVESVEDSKITLPVSSERAVIIKKGSSEIQKLIEKHQGSPIKSSVYEEDQDYSDENIEENYYLDPTQMDQSLLENFGQQNCRSEDQLLQEAILLQEQLIGPVKSSEIESKSQVVMGLEEAFVTDDIAGGFITEAMEDIQNGKKIEERRKLGESQSEAEESMRGSPATEGNLVVDESRTDERKRNSAKRRRSDEVSDLDSDMDDALSEASWNSEDDPDRLWCICRKPHNNRFMICCDECEEWFHGKCVGITKTIGKQMEQDGLEWSCPNCTKKKKMDENVKEAEKIKLLKEKMAQSIREQQQKIRESQKVKGHVSGGKDKTVKSGRNDQPDLKQTKISDYSQRQSSEEETVGRKCIMCKGPVRENSIYCSDDCIRKHSQHAISQLMGDKKSKSESPGSSNPSDGGKSTQRREESRIIVMDASSKKVLVGQQAPTAANLATWLKENPSYHVVYKKSDKSGRFIVTSPKVLKLQPKSTGESSQKVIQLPSGQKVSVQQPDLVKSTQLKLAVSPNSKQVKILQSPVPQGKKQVYQIVSNSSGGAGVKPAAIIVRQKQSEVIDALPLAVKTPGKVVIKGKSVEATTPTQREPASAAAKVEKMPKKRREKVVKVATPGATARELKQSQLVKTDDVKEKEKDRQSSDQQIRDSVKKTLADTLKARVQERQELQFADDHIDGLATDIEEKLYKHFENKTDSKYKSKYRSLVFNIKDPKNETLYRKILENSISPKELVKLSPEELASQELARWREKENQHQLEMIKKTELEAMTIGNTYIMKSHKGEQLIEDHRDQSEVAAVAAEIDPNTPAQELVSALNSVSSTTQDVTEEEERAKADAETSLLKMKNKDRDHRSSRERDRKHAKRDRERRRSRSRSRSRSRRHRSKEKKRGRSRSRSRHHHKDRKSDKKKERDGSRSPEEKSDRKDEITTSEDLEEKKPPVETMDDADHEPSSTVNIKTPDINVEEMEPVNLWKGAIVMADVAKFSGVATEVSGDCARLATDIGEKVDIVGRIPFDTVWDYIARMKKMATKDILVIKIMPAGDEEKASYSTLYSYLSKRSRIGVIGKTGEAVKDFYLYPLASHAPVPQVLVPLDGPGLEDDRENILLGIIVRSKNKTQRSLSIESVTHATTKSAPKLYPVAEEEQEKAGPDRSYTPPLPDDEKMSKKDPRLKRKIRVHVDFNRMPVCNEEDDDSPYSPGDSDEDLPPLPKIAKPGISKLLSPETAGQEGLQDPAEIQRKIEEMNRAIEEQTQQIQSLTSTVPKLAANVPLPTIPLLGSTILSATPSVAHSKQEEVPLLSTDAEDRSGSPVRSFTPPIKIEENIPFLPEVTSKINLPSNLQEILNSIQKKSDGLTDGPPGKLDEVAKASPDVNIALNVLNQTKSLLSSLSTVPKDEKSEESTAILSRLSDEDIIRKAREMEMELEQAAAVASPDVYPSVHCPPQPLPPGVQDIPLISATGTFGFNLPQFPIPDDKLTDSDERKQKKFKLDPKSVFESEGVPDFMPSTSSGATNWDEKKLQKSKNYKIDIKLSMHAIGRPGNVDADGLTQKAIEESKYDVDERILPGKFDEKQQPPQQQQQQQLAQTQRGGSHEGSGGGGGGGRRRRSGDEWEGKREWKYDRRHREDNRRYNKGDGNWRHGGGGGGGGGGRRYGGPKFRKERFDEKRDRHLEKEWEGSIKDFEERQRRRNEEIRREELRRLRKRSESSSN